MRARVLVLFGAEIRTSHPSGSRCRSREPARHPWHSYVPPENLRFQVVSKAWDSRSELPRRTGRQHLVARDLGASPSKSTTAGSRGSIRQRWFEPGTFPELPVAPPKSTKGLRGLERHLVAHDVEAGSGHFVGYRPQGHERAGASLFSFVVLLGQRLEADGEVCSLDKGPGQVRIAEEEVSEEVSEDSRRARRKLGGRAS